MAEALVLDGVTAGHGGATVLLGKAGFITGDVEYVGYSNAKFKTTDNTTDQGLEGLGITYHEVGGEATVALIQRNMTPNLIGRDPF